ncbi:unnamed protein product, partial [marine sediment metagenome]
MPPIAIVLATSVLISLGIGLSVLLTNSSRTQNRGFFLFALSHAIWGSCVLMVLNADNEQSADWYIRWASFTGIQVPLAFHIFCQSIVRPTYSLRRILAHIRYHLASTQVVGMIAFTPL